MSRWCHQRCEESVLMGCRFDHVDLRVRDISKTRPFYEALLPSRPARETLKDQPTKTRTTTPSFSKIPAAIVLRFVTGKADSSRTRFRLGPAHGGAFDSVGQIVTL